MVFLLSTALILTILADRSHETPLNSPIKSPSQSRRSPTPLSGAGRPTLRLPSSMTDDVRFRVHVPTDGYLTPIAPKSTTLKLPSRPEQLDLGKVKPFIDSMIGHVYEPTPSSPAHVYEAIPGGDDPYYLDVIDGKGGPPTPPPRDSDVDELCARALSARDEAMVAENEVSFASAVKDIENAVSKADRAAEEAFRSTQALGLLKGASVNVDKQRISFDTAFRATADARMAAARARTRAATLMIEKCLPERKMRWTLITKMPNMGMDEAVHYQHKMEEAAKKLNEQISKFHHFTKELSRRQGSLIASWLSDQFHVQITPPETAAAAAGPQPPSYIKLWSERDNEAINREKQLMDVITEMSKSALKELWEAAVTALDLMEKFSMTIESSREKARQEAIEQVAKDARERLQQQAMDLAEKQRATDAAKMRREMEAEAKKEATSLMEKLQSLEDAGVPWWTDLMIGVTTAISVVPFGIFLYAVVSSSTPAAAVGGLGAAAAAAAATGTSSGSTVGASEGAVGQALEEAFGTAEAALIGLSHPIVAAGKDTESILTQITSEALPHIIGELPVREVTDSIRQLATTALRRRGTQRKTSEGAALLRRDEALREMVVDAVIDVMQEAIQGAHVAMFGEDM
ncbi:hypothetical protein CP532_1776 [Ophiocordyceps camponoti-leonardi (nom. inval.)]|nr:hypothetical protein CP532_1776 [Ophiocordyceps camponoti-leonardi (nom. inval.)]